MPALTSKLKQFNYFSPDFSLSTTIAKTPQIVVGVLLSIFSLALVCFTIYEGLVHYIDIKSISVSSSYSFVTEIVKVNIIENDFYPVLRMKPYFELTFYNNTKLMRMFRIQGTVSTKGLNGTISATTFEFRPCSEISSQYKEFLIENSSNMENLVNT